MKFKRSPFKCFRYDSDAPMTHGLVHTFQYNQSLHAFETTLILIIQNYSIAIHEKDLKLATIRLISHLYTQPSKKIYAIDRYLSLSLPHLQRIRHEIFVVEQVVTQIEFGEVLQLLKRVRIDPLDLVVAEAQLHDGTVGESPDVSDAVVLEGDEF